MSKIAHDFIKFKKFLSRVSDIEKPSWHVVKCLNVFESLIRDIEDDTIAEFEWQGKSYLSSYNKAKEISTRAGFSHTEHAVEVWFYYLADMPEFLEFVDNKIKMDKRLDNIDNLLDNEGESEE